MQGLFSLLCFLENVGGCKFYKTCSRGQERDHETMLATATAHSVVDILRG